MESLSAMELVMVVGVAAVAYLVRGLAGFGSALIAMPLLLLVLPITTAVPLVVALDYLASAAQGLRDRRQIRWDEIWPLLPTAVLGVASAVILFRRVPQGQLVKVLAVFLIVFALYQLRGPAVGHAAARAWAIPTGALGGLVGTLFGTGGPFYVAYLQARRLDKTAFRATFSTIFLLDGANRLVGYAASGFFTLDFVSLLGLLLPVMFLGMYAGRRLHTDLSQDTFRRGISGLLLFSGTVLLLR